MTEPREPRDPAQPPAAPAQQVSHGHMPPRLLNNARSVRWALVLGAAAMVGIGLVLFFMLTLATSNQALYEVNYSRLLTINAAVAALLGGIILWGGLRLLSRVRRNKFGSRLLLKLAGICLLYTSPSPRDS